jgi:tyrosyl-tRNA synthetase
MLRSIAAIGMDELATPIAGYLRRHGGAVASAAPEAARPANGSGDKRFELLRSVGEECQTEKELQSLLERKPDFFLYDGFEPSGRMHIAQGVFKSINVNKCTAAGGTFIFWVADWFALMNDKMGGDLEKIKTVGQYLVEVWKAAGMDMTRVKFLWSSDEISSHAKDYWGQALHIACRTNMTRIKKCCQIMGRNDEEKLTAAQILYPIMQCTDIFFLQADICQLGVDQRKVNMLARDYCDAAGRKLKPVILSHHMLYGLKAGQSKMSKSDPDSAIFMEDTPEDVKRKIQNAYCPREVNAEVKHDDEMSLVKDDLKNPCLDYLKYILFSNEKFVFTVGSKTYKTYDDARAAFIAGELSEQVLKDCLVLEINKLLDPVRNHFANDPVAKDLLGKITQWKKENLVVTTSSKKLKFIDPKNGPVFAVFAPMPREVLYFEAVIEVLQRLRACPSGCQLVLWLEDWSAYALGKVGGSQACISAFYELLLHGLRSIAPELMKKVRVCWQQEMILAGPSEYWISVINAGRGSNLGDVTRSLPPGESLEFAGQVLSSLMHVGDVMALCEGVDVTLCCDKYHENLHNFAAGYCDTRGLGRPKVQTRDPPRLRLLAEEEGGLEAEVNLMLTDKELDVNRKMKKAFCQPQNITHCPPILWASELLDVSSLKELLVARKPDNGGDKKYTKAKDIWGDFESGALHPGDLKPAIGKMLNQALEAVRPGLKDSDSLKKAQKELENFAKSLNKKK